MQAANAHLLACRLIDVVAAAMVLVFQDQLHGMDCLDNLVT